MQSTESINLVEVVIRDLIREVIGEDWRNDPEVDIEKLKASQKNEADRRRGAIVSTDLLDFADFLLLQHIINNKWEKFKPILKSQKHFKVYMDRLGAFRNTLMHSRNLLPFEEALLVGMTGEIRNEVTIWRSIQGPDMEYYPGITQITDSHGLELTPGRGTGSGDVIKQTGLILRPGNVVTFRCVGTDPHGRSLKWALFATDLTSTQQLQDTAEGDEVVLTWRVDAQHIRESQMVIVQLISGGEHHRNGDYDHIFGFNYQVAPPLNALPGNATD